MNKMKLVNSVVDQIVKKYGSFVMAHNQFPVTKKMEEAIQSIGKAKFSDLLSEALFKKFDHEAIYEVSYQFDENDRLSIINISGRYSVPYVIAQKVMKTSMDRFEKNDGPSEIEISEKEAEAIDVYGIQMFTEEVFRALDELTCDWFDEDSPECMHNSFKGVEVNQDDAGYYVRLRL